MKKTLFLAAVFGAAFVSPAMADDVQHEAEGMYYMYAGTAAQTAGATYTLDATSKDSVIFTPEGNDLVTNTLMEVDVKSGATVTAKNSGWNADVRCMDLTIETLKVGDGTGTVNLTTSYSTTFVVTDTIPTQQESQKLTIDQVQGTVSSITNAATMTLGSTGVTTSISGTAVNSGNLTLLGNITFDVSSMTGYTLTDSSAMSAPADNKNGFASGTGVYALVSNSGTVDATGATVTTTDGDTITTTDGTMTISKTGTGTKYYIQDGSSVALSTIQGEGSVTDVAVSNGTLELDATGVGLNKITGSGNVNVTTATSLTGSLASAATGTLTVGDDVTLTVGTSDGQTNSLTSFTAVNLAGGTITYQNKKDTLNNVTVASGSTGIINSVDMGNAAGDTLTLAGTTTVGGELTIQNLWNAQFAIEKLTGNGTLSIKGTDGGSSSTETATYTLGDTSTFTGTLNIGNSKATVTQTFSTLAAMTADLTYTVTGDGTVVKTCTAGISGDTDLGAASGTISGAITGGTITGGTGDITLSGAISDSTINGNNHVTVASETISNTTLNAVALGGAVRKTLSGTVNMDGVLNDLTNGTNGYAIVGSGAVSLNITGTTYLDTTSGAEANDYSMIGLGSSSTITVKEGAMLTTGAIMNTVTSVSAADTKDNANVVVEEGGMLSVGDKNTTVMTTLNNAGTTEIAGKAIIGTLTNSGDLTLGNATSAVNSITLNGGTITLGSEESHDNDLTVSDLTVSGTGSKINANLVMTTGSLTFVGSATLDMGCDVTISDDVKVFLDKSVIDQTDPNKFITLVNISDTENSTINVGSNTVYVYYMDGENEVMTDRTLAYNATTGVIYATPEPATATLSLLALAGLAARRRRK